MCRNWKCNGVFVKSQKWHDTHFLTLRHNTKIVEFYPTMAAETDSYEDNANELHPWYYTQREPIASALYDYR